MTPKFKDVATRLSQLQHNLDYDAQKLSDRIEKTDARRSVVFEKAHSKVEAAHVELDGIDGFLEEIEKTNHGPLDGSEPRSSDLMKG